MFWMLVFIPTILAISYNSVHLVRLFQRLNLIVPNWFVSAEFLLHGNYIMRVPVSNLLNQNYFTQNVDD